MSVIENTTIKRGDKLTAAEINAEFTAVNAAFTLDADNFRNEALDQPAFDLQTANGKSGLILRQTGSTDLITSASPVNIDANEATPSASIPATQLGVFNNGGAALITAQQNNIIRVYWQHRLATITGAARSAPYSNTKCGLCWAIWLEWQLSSGGSFAQVPGQGDLITAIDNGSSTGGFGNLTEDLRATSLDFHSFDYRKTNANPPATSDQLQIMPGERNGYGQWYYKFTSDTTIYGLRLMCRGLYEPCHPSTSHNKNAIRITQAAAPVSPATVNYRLGINHLQLSYLLMRDQ